MEVPAVAGGRTLALVITGDGDWSTFIRGTSETLARNGIPTVALKARAYMARPRTPEQTARDAERILRQYLTRWKLDEIVLVGYSRGADWMPFIASRLPPDLRNHVRLVALMSPERMAGFEFRLVDLIRSTSRASDLPTLPEVEKLHGVPILCVYGKGEGDSLCPAAPHGLMHVVAREGGHRTTDFGMFAGLILDELRH